MVCHLKACLSLNVDFQLFQKVVPERGYAAALCTDEMVMVVSVSVPLIQKFTDLVAHAAIVQQNAVHQLHFKCCCRYCQFFVA